MNKNKIQGILNDELNIIRSCSNMRGIDFHKVKTHLITPYKKDFLNPLLGCIEKHWVVFDEDKHNEEQGYVIFYSEKDCAFGLGTKTNLQKLHNVGTFIGIYGSFIDALDSM
jgi:hypothetical protein